MTTDSRRTRLTTGSRSDVNGRRIRIGAVAARGGVSPEAVRYYEKQGLLPSPERAPSGYRLYSEEHLARMDFIKRAQGFGLSLNEIRQILQLREAAYSACRHIEKLLESKIEAVDRQMEQLALYREDLMHSLGACHRSLRRHPEDRACPVIARWDARPPKPEKE